MTTRRLAALFLCIAAFLLASPAVRADAKPGGVLTLADAAWLAGAWEGDALGGHAEERWSKPDGGTMVGTFRLVMRGNTRVLEFLLLVETKSGVVMRFHHYSPDLTVWEERPLELHLAHADDDRLVFVNEASDQPSEIVYARRDDTVKVTVKSINEIGEPQMLELTLKRAGQG